MQMDDYAKDGQGRSDVFVVFTMMLCGLKGQLQRFDKLTLFDRFGHVENGFDITF